MSLHTTERAWQIYAKDLPKNTRNCADRRKVLCEFVAVKPRTVRRWITTNSVSGVGGTNAIKLRVFLELSGFTITELHSLKNSVKTCAEILAFGMIKIEDVCAAVNGSVSPSTINRTYSILLGRTEAASEQIQLFEMFNLAHSSALKNKRVEWQERVVATSGAPVEQVSPPETARKSSGEKISQIVSPEPAQLGPESKLMKEIFVSLAPTFLALVAFLVSNACTPEERKRLRAQVGEEKIFRISTATARLCNETSRAQYAQTKGSDR